MAYEMARSESAGRLRACQRRVNKNAGVQRRKTAPPGTGWRPASRPDQVEQIAVGEAGAHFAAVEEGRAGFEPAVGTVFVCFSPEAAFVLSQLSRTAF